MSGARREEIFADGEIRDIDEIAAWIQGIDQQAGAANATAAAEGAEDADDGINVNGSVFKDLPLSVQEALLSFDLMKTGYIQACECVDGMELLHAIRDGCKHGDRPATHDEVVKGVELMSRVMKSHHIEDPTELDYTHFSPKVQKVIKVLDKSGDGAISVDELQAAAKAFEQLRKSSSRMKKMLIVAVVVMIMMFAAMFGMGMWTAELAKDFKVNAADPKLATKDGKTVATASADFTVDANGKMVPRTSTSRRLSEQQAWYKDESVHIKVFGTCSADGCKAPSGERLLQEVNDTKLHAASAPQSLATSAVLFEAPVTATAPSALLAELKTVTITRGESKVSLDVSSAASMPAAGTLCGVSVQIGTRLGDIVLLDSSVFLSPTLAGHDSVVDLTGNTSRVTESGHVKLGEGAAVLGHFNKLPVGVSPTACSTSAIPPSILSFASGSGSRNLHLKGQASTPDALQVGKVERQIFITDLHTFMLDSVAGSDRVTVLERPSGMVTTFHSNSQGDLLFCASRATDATQALSLTWEFAGVTFDINGPQSLWRARYGGRQNGTVTNTTAEIEGAVQAANESSPFVAEVAIDLATALPRIGFA